MLHGALQASNRGVATQSAMYAGKGRHWLRSDIFRAELGGNLAEMLPGEWSLDDGERAHRGALLLRHGGGYIQARIQRVETDGSLPEARSDMRRRFYRNTDIDDVDILNKVRHNLVFSFSEKVREGVFGVRAIRPHVSPTKTYSIQMPFVAESFASSKFEVANEDSFNELFGDDFAVGEGLG